MKLIKLSHYGLSFILLLMVGCASVMPATGTLTPSNTVFPPPTMPGSRTLTPSNIALQPTTVPTAIGLPCVGPPDDTAWDMVFLIQNDTIGQYLADSGVLIHKGDTISNDNNGKNNNAGFWRSYEDREFTVNFSDINGEPYAQLGLMGEVRWDATSCIYKGVDSFKWIQVGTNTRLNIGNSEVEQGHLVLTDEQGNKYIILYFGPTFNGVMQKQ
jgi:hypothetical protein